MELQPEVTHAGAHGDEDVLDTTRIGLVLMTCTHEAEHDGMHDGAHAADDDTDTDGTTV